jgi:hypothetical protein
VNVWLVAATVLLAGLVPCAWVLVRGELTEALVALELSSTGTVPNPNPPRGSIARPARPGRPARHGLRDLQRLDLAVHGQLLERLRLDLAHALSRHAELAPDRLE